MVVRKERRFVSIQELQEVPFVQLCKFNVIGWQVNIFQQTVGNLSDIPARESSYFISNSFY